MGNNRHVLHGSSTNGNGDGEKNQGGVLFVDYFIFVTFIAVPYLEPPHKGIENICFGIHNWEFLFIFFWFTVLMA